MRPATGFAIVMCATAGLATSGGDAVPGAWHGDSEAGLVDTGRRVDAPAAEVLAALGEIDAPLGLASRASVVSRAGGAPFVFDRDGARDPGPVRAPTQEFAGDYALGKPYHEFFFARGRYSDRRGGRRGRGSWATDYPEADYIFTSIIDQFLDIDVYLGETTPSLVDPELRRFPFLYILEVGGMSLYPEEVEGLRSYLLQGGFMVVDDFWDDDEWWNFQLEIAQVFPDYPIVDIPFEHPVLHAIYDVDEIIQVPNINNAQLGYRTGECRYDPVCAPFVKGIFDEKGRLMVLINGNTDLGDAWEHADNPYYDTYFSTYAFFMGMNMIVYALAN